MPNPGDKVLKDGKLRDNLSPTFNQYQDLVRWIGEQQYFEMLIRHFSNNPNVCGYVGKLPEQDLNVLLSSNIEHIFFRLSRAGALLRFRFSF